MNIVLLPPISFDRIKFELGFAGAFLTITISPMFLCCSTLSMANIRNKTTAFDLLFNTDIVSRDLIR